LVPIEVHYMEKNAEMFSSKNLISFRLKKERHGHLGWHGGEEIISKFFEKWTTPLSSWFMLVWFQVWRKLSLKNS